jgi:hypothetical protein
MGFCSLPQKFVASLETTLDPDIRMSSDGPLDCLDGSAVVLNYRARSCQCLVGKTLGCSSNSGGPHLGTTRLDDHNHRTHYSLSHLVGGNSQSQKATTAAHIPGLPRESMSFTVRRSLLHLLVVQRDCAPVAMPCQALGLQELSRPVPRGATLRMSHL